MFITVHLKGGNIHTVCIIWKRFCGSKLGQKWRKQTLRHWTAQFAASKICIPCKNLGQWMSRMLNCFKPTAKCSACQGWILQPVCAWSTSKRLEISLQATIWMRSSNSKGCEFWKQGPLQYGSAKVAYNIMTNSPKCYRLHLIKAYVTPHMNLSRLGKRPLQYCSAYVMYQYHDGIHISTSRQCYCLYHLKHFENKHQCMTA